MMNQSFDKLDEYKKETIDFLQKVVSNQSIHAKWLNLLSYLEFIGSRKIFKTQQPGIINESVLKHASDEARHAFFLKQLITQVSNIKDYENYNSGTMLAPYSGFRYIQCLDAIVKRKLKSRPYNRESISYICYVYMSYIIEVRANWLYDLYDQILRQNHDKVNISMIISDEVRHLAEMQSEISRVDKENEENISFFTEKENRIFIRLLNGLTRELLKENS